MKILILTVQYYPVMTPNVYRWSAIVAYWAQQGHEVHVVTSWRRGIPKESVEEGVFIHRAGSATLMDWAYNLFQIKERRGEARGIKAKRHSLARKILEQIIDWTWRKVYWPDGSCLWYWPARKRAQRLLQSYAFDAMISVGLPFTAHWVGKFVKSQYPGLCWLVDIEDPFCFSREFFVNNFALYQKINRRAEAVVFSMAVAIAVTVARARERYVNIFPQAAPRIWVIPPLFNLPFPGQVESRAERGVICLAYFGSFYEKVRTPTAFLNLLMACAEADPSLLRKLEVHFYGELDGPAFETFENFRGLLPVIRFHGLVSREEVGVAMKAVDVLVNIGNTTDYHLPSKSVDYLMSGKPVISLSYVDNDPFSQLFDGYPLFRELRVGGNGAEEAKNLAGPFMDFIIRNRGKRVPSSLLDELGRPYRLENIAWRYLQLLRGHL